MIRTLAFSFCLSFVLHLKITLISLTAFQYLPYVIRDMSIALLSIWSPGLGAWVGPGSVTRTLPFVV